MTDISIKRLCCCGLHHERDLLLFHQWRHVKHGRSAILSVPEPHSTSLPQQYCASTYRAAPAATGSAVACDAPTCKRGCECKVVCLLRATGSVKGMTAAQLEECGCQLILGNTYHLESRPGADTVAAAGGLHDFTGWRRAMLTDSGGFQVCAA